MPGLEKIVQNLPVNENIWVAAGEGRIEDVEVLLKTGGPDGCPLDPDVRDEYGYTPLHAAASYAHLDIIQMLIQNYSANVNVTDTEGDTPLHLVDKLDAAQMLVQFGADPTIKNDAGFLPIEAAYMEQCHDIVEFLSQFTPDYREIGTDTDEESALQYILENVDHDELTPEMLQQLHNQLVVIDDAQEQPDA